MLIAQVTDTHITTDGEPARYLAEAIDWINGMQPRPEVVLLSGDTVNDGRREQYAALAAILARCEPALYVVPGNHDRRELLRETLPESFFPDVRGRRLNFAVETAPVRLIGLDTAEYGWPGGRLDTAGLAWLETTLSAAPERPALVFMHHPPFRTGVNAADVFGFRPAPAARDRHASPVGPPDRRRSHPLRTQRTNRRSAGDDDAEQHAAASAGSFRAAVGGRARRARRICAP